MRQNGFGDVTGDQCGDGDAELAPESWNDSVRWARCTIRARRSPRLVTSESMTERSSAVSENSAATNRAVPRVSATKPTRPAT